MFNHEIISHFGKECSDMESMELVQDGEVNMFYYIDGPSYFHLLIRSKNLVSNLIILTLSHWYLVLSRSLKYLLHHYVSELMNSLLTSRRNETIMMTTSD